MLEQSPVVGTPAHRPFKPNQKSIERNRLDCCCIGSVIEHNRTGTFRNRWVRLPNSIEHNNNNNNTNYYYYDDDDDDDDDDDYEDDDDNIYFYSAILLSYGALQQQLIF